MNPKWVDNAFKLVGTPLEAVTNETGLPAERPAERMRSLKTPTYNGVSTRRELLGSRSTPEATEMQGTIGAIFTGRVKQVG